MSVIGKAGLADYNLSSTNLYTKLNGIAALALAVTFGVVLDAFGEKSASAFNLGANIAFKSKF